MTTLIPSIGQPIRSLQNCLRRISSHYNEIPRIIPDGIYGNQTEHCVRQFQKKFELPPTGEVNFETWEKIINIYLELLNYEPQHMMPYTNSSLVIGNGQSYPVMHIIQSMLVHLSKEYANILCPEVTGVHDDNSVEAVKSFQKLCEMPDDGIVTSKLWNNLNCAFMQSVRKV